MREKQSQEDKCLDSQISKHGRNDCFTLIRSIPASILSCSTSFLAWAILLVVDILIHQNTPTLEKTEGERKK